MRLFLFVAAVLVAFPAHAALTFDEIMLLLANGGNTVMGPTGVATDADGNVFVAATNSHNVFRITPMGTITEILDVDGDGINDCSGAPPLPAGCLQSPFGVATDTGGNVYVTGVSSSNVFKVTPSGTRIEVIDEDGTNASGTCSAMPQTPGCMREPFGIAVDLDGNVFVAGGSSANAFKITPGGAITEIIDATGDGVSPLTTPLSVAVDADGNAFVSGFNSQNVFKITPSLQISEIIDVSGGGTGTLGGAESLAVDADGIVYVAGRTTNNVFRVTPSGTTTRILNIDGVNSPGSCNMQPLPAGCLLDPRDVALDASGNLFVVGGQSDNAIAVAPNGMASVVLDSTGDGLGNALETPLGVTTDLGGNVYVSGFSSNNAFALLPEPGHLVLQAAGVLTLLALRRRTH